MTTTPSKPVDSSINESLTPVRFLDSPRLKSTPSDSNFIASKSRLEVIVKTLQDNYSKWQLAQKRGLALCASIEAIKVRALEAVDNPSSDADKPDTLYPKELRAYCDKLAVITSIFEDIARNARESLRQLGALCKLPGIGEAIFYRSWPLPQYVTWTEQLFSFYERESRVKQHIMRELPHCTNRADLIRCTAAWEYPQHVDDWVTLMFAFLAEEISVGKK